MRRPSASEEEAARRAELLGKKLEVISPRGKLKKRLDIVKLMTLRNAVSMVRGAWCPSFGLFVLLTPDAFLCISVEYKLTRIEI